MNINKLWFPWKPAHVQLGIITDARLGDCYQYVPNLMFI